MDAMDALDTQPQPTVRAGRPTVRSAPAAGARFRRSVVLALVGRGVLGALLLLGSGCGAVSAGHTPGLPSAVPLPAQSTFVKQTQPGCSGCTGQSWYYTVASTQPQQIASFYEGRLPAQGWQEVRCQLYSPEHAHCLARDSQRVLTIMGVSQPLFEIAPPPGGVVLAIVLLAT
jgi:hypothetical protein